MLFAITFTLLSGERSHNADTSVQRALRMPSVRPQSGNIRRFRRICEHIQSQVCSKRFPGPNSPPERLPSVTTAVSESSSCGSDSSERLSCYKRQVREPIVLQTQSSHFQTSHSQIENDIEADTVFDTSKPSARRSSASTNNNNPSPVEPGSPKTVRSR